MLLERHRRHPEHGFFHVDVHAGNLFVTPQGAIAFLDFGIMGRLDDRTRLVLRRALPAVLIDGDFRTIVRAVFNHGAVTTPVDLEQAAADVRELLEPLATKPLAEISYGELLGHILRVATAYHVVLPRELVLVVKQLLYFERYDKELAPDYKILGDPSILAHVTGPPVELGDGPRLLRGGQPRHGHGIHHCLGAALARLEARLVGETLMAQGMRMTPGEGADRIDSIILRGFARYPVTA